MSIVSHQESAICDRPEQIQRLWLILILRSLLFSLELYIGLKSHSLSLLAGSGHLFVDVLTLSLTLFAVWILRNRANLDYQKVSAWLGLGNGISLVTIATLIIWEAIEHLQTPETILGLSMFVGASCSLVVNGSITYLLHEDNHQDLNMRGVFLHGVADAASSIALLIAAMAVYFFDWFWADSISSLFVAGLIGFNAIVLIGDSWKFLNQELPS